MCYVCTLGETGSAPDEGRLGMLRDVIDADPDTPITLAANVGSIFAFQDPGTQEDTPEGTDFNLKRDMDILWKMDLVPGSTLPARMMFLRLLDRIPTTAGICGYDTVTSPAWQGCVRARTGYYEQGHARGIGAIIPARDEAEMAEQKRVSIAALRSATNVKVRPHLLLCAVCQYGRGIRPPFAEDNLPEFLQVLMHDNPDLTVTLVQGADWDMCAPCPYRNVAREACITGRNGSGGLYCQNKDLNVMQALGLKYGDTLTAREFYRLAFEEIHTTAGICAMDNEGLSPHSPWFNACDARVRQTDYIEGRAALMKAGEAFGP
jgi:hypothetical protein